MTQTIDEILDDLHTFVAGRGSNDNFLYTKDYQRGKSSAKGIDFSPWIGLHLMKNDTRALAVFQAQLSRDGYFGVSVSVNPSKDGKSAELGDITTDASNISFEIDVNRFELEINHLLQFSFESYFINDIRQAKIDLIIGWLLRYGDDQLSRVMTPYYLEFKNADAYIAKFSQHRKTRMELPVSLPNDKSFSLFQQELKKLPFASRLHFFDFLEFSKHGKKSELKHLNGMIPNARRAGVDENESANILRQSKLIKSFPDGTGFVSPEYLDSATIALDYAKKIAPVYYEWKSEVTGLISDQLGIFVYDSKDPNSGQYVRPDEFED